MSSASLQDLYHQTVLEHAVNPRGFQTGLDATHQASRENLVCGDQVEIHLQLEGNQLQQAAFSGESCAICTASASLLCVQAENCDVGSFQRTAALLLELLDRNNAEPVTGIDQELMPLAGVLRFPARINCARLPWQAALDALANDPDQT